MDFYFCHCFLFPPRFSFFCSKNCDTFERRPLSTWKDLSWRWSFFLNDWNQITTFSNDFRSWPVGFPFKKEFCSQPSCWSKTTPPGFFGPKKVSWPLGGWESREASLAVWSKWIRKVSSGQEGGQPFNPAEAVRSGRTQGKVAPRTSGWKGQDMWFAWPLFSNDDVQPPPKMACIFTVSHGVMGFFLSVMRQSGAPHETPERALKPWVLPPFCWHVVTFEIQGSWGSTYARPA